MTRRIIYCGWDTPPTESLPSVRSFAQQQPTCRGVDGFVAQAIRNGQPNNLLNVATREPWSEADFAGSQPGGTYLWSKLLNPEKDPVNWADNARWKLITEKVRLLGVVAKRLGCDGILLDIEAYQPAWPLWKCRTPSDFKMLSGWAFRRGLEMRPDVTIAFHQLLSHLIDLVPPVGGGWRQVPIEEHAYGLLPSFANGLISSGEGLIDHCGTNRPRSPKEVYEQVAAIQNTLPEICGVDYQSVRIGQSLYLNQYPDGVPNFYEMAEAYWQCSQTGLLLYGESGRLCEPNGSIHAPPPIAYPLWTDSIKGFSDTLRRVADPATFAHEFVKNHQNILGEFRFGRPSGSEVTRPGFADTLFGKGSGWLFQVIAMQPGDSFAFSCHSTTRDCWIGARWQTKAGVWVEDRESSRKFFPDGAGQCAGVVVAPSGVEQMLVTCAANHKESTDRTTFSDAVVCKI